MLLAIVLIVAACVGIYYATRKAPEKAPEAQQPVVEQKKDEAKTEEKKEEVKAEEKKEEAKTEEKKEEVKAEEKKEEVKPEEKKDEAKTEEKKEEVKAEEKKEEPKAADKEAFTVRWVSLGNGQPENYATWIEKFNAYAMEKIGVKLDVEVLSWGAYGDKRNAMINGGEYFDIVFTDAGSLKSDIDKGALLDLTDLIPKYAPKLWETIPKDTWEASKVGGKLYAIPTIKDSAMAHYMVWDPAVAEKTGMDLSKVKSFEDLTAVFKKMKEVGFETPVEINKSGYYHIIDAYDTLGSGTKIFGVHYQDKARKVVPIFEQEDIVKQLKLANQWMKDGLVNQGAATLTQTNSYRPFYLAQGWEGAWKVDKTDTICLTYPLLGPIFSNGSVRGSMNGIYSGTKNVEAALKLLELVNTDPKARDMICYGEEGVNFDYVEGGKYVKPNQEKGFGWARYTQANHLILTPEETNKNFIEQLTTLNKTATPSVMLGFSPDYSKLESELAALRATYEKYEAELITGTRAPEDIVPQMMKELRAIGLDDVMKELQKQIDEFYK